MEPTYPDPIQGGNEAVTRQVGLPPSQDVGFDRTPDKPVIQGSHEIFTSRNIGLGQRFLADGTLLADAPAPGTTYFADVPVIAVGEANQPPAPAAAGAPPSVPPLVGVMQSDQPDDRGAGADPRDASVGPQVISADKLPVIKKAPIVPVVLPTPKVRRVRAKKG
jgi:hypothetical protein